MTNIDIEALRALAKKATPGPWSMRRVRERGHDVEHRPVTGHMAGLLDGPTYIPHYEDSILARHDARFIAALDPTTVLTLLTDLAAARKEERWIAPSERLPGNNEEVAFVALNRRCVGTYRGTDHPSRPWADLLCIDVIGDSDRYSTEQVTHWQPLPELPSSLG